MEQAVRNYQYHLSNTKYKAKIAELTADHEVKYATLRANAVLDHRDPEYYVEKEQQTRQSKKEPLMDVVRRVGSIGDLAEIVKGNLGKKTA
jgi:hypothetical protein